MYYHGMDMEPELSMRQKAWQRLKQFMLTQPNSLTFIVFIGAGLALSFSYLSQNFVDPPPFHYEEPIAWPVDDTVCPGDLLIYDVALEITDPPVMLMVARAWWSVEDQITTLPDPAPSWVVYQDIVSVGATRRIPVPDLPHAGSYEYRVGAQTMQSEAAVYIVPFTVPESCFNDG